MLGVGGSPRPWVEVKARAALVSALTGPATGIGGSGGNGYSASPGLKRPAMREAQRTQWICADASGSREVRSSLEVTIR
jgi:hypothetical protein